MQRSGDFVNLYCSSCGYEEEVHFKEVERRSLRCPHCGHFIDYEEVSIYSDKEDLSQFDFDDELDNFHW